MSSHTNYPSLSSTYLETIQKQLGYLSTIIGNIQGILESMSDGNHRNQLINETHRLTLIDNEIKKALEEHRSALISTFAFLSTDSHINQKDI